SARHNAAQIQYLLPQLPRIDVVIALVGVNDMNAALAQGWSYHAPAESEDAVLRRAFARLPRPAGTTWFKRTWTWELLRRARQNAQVRTTFAEGGADLILARARRDSLPAVASLPPHDA